MGAGIGALTGAMLLGSAKFIAEAVQHRRNLGGNAATFFPFWLDCEQRWRETTGMQTEANASITGADCFTRRLDRLGEFAAILKGITELSGHVMVWPRVLTACGTHIYLQGSKHVLERIHSEAVAATGVRLWETLLCPGFGSRFALKEDDPWCYFEWRVGDRNCAIPDAVVATVWTDFNNRLVAHHWREQMLFLHRNLIQRRTDRPLLALAGGGSQQHLMGFNLENMNGNPFVAIMAALNNVGNTRTYDENCVIL